MSYGEPGTGKLVGTARPVWRSRSVKRIAKSSSGAALSLHPQSRETTTSGRGHPPGSFHPHPSQTGLAAGTRVVSSLVIRACDHRKLQTSDARAALVGPSAG